MDLSLNVPREPLPLIPPLGHPELWIMLITTAAATVYGFWTWLFLFWAVTLLLYPFPDWENLLKMLRVAVTTYHKDVPVTHQLAGFFFILWKVFYCWPPETILWILDEFLFPEYKNTKIKEPLFLLGQPRSGTTMFETILSEDKEQFCSMLLYEMRYPYLSLQYTVDCISSFDQKFCGGRIYKFLLWSGSLSSLPETGERKNMRRLRYDLPDEDDLVFFFHTFCHFMFLGIFPRPDAVEFNHRFSELPKETRDQYMELHRRAVQKVMYRRGQGRQYLAKWVAGWNGQLDEVKTLYPDAKYVVVVRDPKDSLPSWLKLQGLLARHIAGNNVLRNHPEIREVVIKENIAWFHKEIEFCKETSRKHMLVLRYSDLIADIPEQVRVVYDFLGRYIEKGSHFHEFLHAKKTQQSKHQKTRIGSSDRLITDEQIEKYFPNLLTEIEFSSPPKPSQASRVEHFRETFAPLA